MISVVGKVFLLWGLFVFSYAQGATTHWSSYPDGFPAVTWGGVPYPQKPVDRVLEAFKATASLYQGIAGEGSDFNASPNLATATIGFVVSHNDGPGEIKSFPLTNKDRKTIVFSSSNKGVYGKELLPEVVESLGDLGTGAADYCFYTYANLFGAAARTGGAGSHEGAAEIHSEDLMMIFMKSAEGKVFFEESLKAIKSSFPGDEVNLRLSGMEIFIHSWFDICEGCQKHFHKNHANFYPSKELCEKYAIEWVRTPSFLFNIFSEKQYGKSPELLGNPLQVTLRGDGKVHWVASRRKADSYGIEVIPAVLESLKIRLAPFTVMPEESSRAPSKRLRIEESEEGDDEAEFDGGAVASPTPKTDSCSILHWIGAVLSEHGNRALLTDHGITDAHIVGFAEKVLQKELWQFPFSHHYGWDQWDRLQEVGELKADLPFFFGADKPPLLLMDDERVSEGVVKNFSALQKKWHAYHPWKNRPFFGWREIARTSVEEGVGALGGGGKAYCQMCGNTKLENLCHVAHDHTSVSLFVGSECVQYMTLPEGRVRKSFDKSRARLDKVLSKHSKPAGGGSSSGKKGKPKKRARSGGGR